ncbi:hypothetical protein BT96DRAFT_313391 [Gymnopus androsaceus JB14]|uniref:Uncharacterized protein n=1 Tax=Gymnopus androsaceus JB14 TaxID=1447944 RepID=A0A6A4I1L8_9AGAR|nr:hypothetical protein BT96DRAFT_313391 [Gymnopus androsaceus JB14]
MYYFGCMHYCVLIGRCLGSPRRLTVTHRRQLSSSRALRTYDVDASDSCPEFASIFASFLSYPLVLMTLVVLVDLETILSEQI